MFLMFGVTVSDDLLSFLASSGASHRIAAAMDDETSAIEGAMTTALRRVGLHVFLNIYIRAVHLQIFYHRLIDHK